jgi:nicotinate-nucleotide pyrophosphorylase
MANGHDKHALIKAIKTRYPFITLMVGNVANQNVYEFSNAGADYVRVGIVWWRLLNYVTHWY